MRTRISITRTRPISNALLIENFKEKKLTKPSVGSNKISLLSLNILKVYEQALETFNGSLLKLAITCGNEEHCLLLKFKSTNNKRTVSVL